MSMIKNVIGDHLRAQSIRRHRSRLGRRDAPRYSRYLDHCRTVAGGAVPPAGDLASAVAEFTKNGVTSFQSPEGARVAAAMMKRLGERENSGEAVWENDIHEIGNHNYPGDLWNDFPELESLFRGPLGVFLSNYFGAHFKILYGTLYRSVGGDRNPSGSQLWHSDSGPGICVNVMYYLEDTAPENGALQALPWEHSLVLYLREPAEVRTRAQAEGLDPAGPERRRITADYYDERIAERYNDKVYQPTGNAGLIVPFLNNTLHRGGFPVPGRRRTAIVFHCYPSDSPTNFDRYRVSGIRKDAPYPTDPAEEF